MRDHITIYLDKAINILLLVTAGIIPLLFLNKTTEFFETPKLIFLIISTSIMAVLWIASWIAKGKITVVKTPLDFPLLFLAGIVLVSTFFSPSKYTAIYGNLPVVHGSAVSWITYILLYFITVSNLKDSTKIKKFLLILYSSATIVALITLLSFFSIFLPFNFAKAVNFTPTGSSFSTTALLLLLLPFPFLSLIYPNRYFLPYLALILSCLFTVTIALIGGISIYVVLGIAFGLCLLISKAHQIKKTLLLSLVPVFLAVAVLLASHIPSSKPFNFIQQKELNFPKEIQLPFSTSWKVTVSALRDAPLIGTGPSSYLFNFTAYKPIEFNLFKFWNYSFDIAYNEFLQVLGTLGILGFAGLLLISVATLRSSLKYLFMKAQQEEQKHTLIIPFSLAISSILSIILLAIHAVTLVSITITLFILAAFMMSRNRKDVFEFTLGISAKTSDNKRFDLFPIIIAIILLIGAFVVFSKIAKLVAADYYHRLALSQIKNNNSTLTYKYVQKAINLNPYSDLYRIDVAQANFAIANAIASKRKADGNTLSEQDKSTIQTLINQAITEGRAATTLNPRSARNWEVLAAIYRGISGVASNATAFSLDAYGNAIQRDPVNPNLRINIGGIYYASKNYDFAIRFFNDAINLKPDYANAYYNLSIALRDKGDLQSAKRVAERTLFLLRDESTSSDYKTASEVLQDINTRIAQKTTSGAAKKALKTSEKESALQSPIEDVTISDLDNPPEKIVTPIPVKDNPDTISP